MNYNEEPDEAERRYYEQIVDEEQYSRAARHEAPKILDITNLPAEVIAYINDLAISYQCPREFVMAAVLTAAATALGERFSLNACGYTNYPVLWLMVVAPSGSNKSAPAKRVFSHLFDCNYRLENRWMAEHIAKDSNDKTNANAAETKWFDRPKRLILGDVTPEALNLNLLNNGSGLMMYRDEARGFFDDLNRYGGTGAITDLLSIYDSTPITIDRVGTRPYTIPRPLLNFYGTTQPGVIADFLSGGKFCDSGFNQRMLFVIPDKVPTPTLTDTQPRHDLQLLWDTLLQSCIEATPREYRLSAEAFDAYNDFYTEMGMLQSDEEDDYMRAVYSKLRIQALRLALTAQGLSDVASGSDNNVVTGYTMQAACRSCNDYFLPNARSVRRLVSEPVQKQVSKKDVIRYILENNPHATALEIAGMIGAAYSYVRKVITGTC